MPSPGLGYMRLTPFLTQAPLAARSLFRQPRRAALAMAALVGGVVAFLLAGGFIQWVLESMREATIHSQLGHVQITRPGYFREGLGDPYHYLLPASPQSIEALGPENAITTVAPRLALTGLISKGDETVAFIGEGIDPGKERPITKAIHVTQGDDLADGATDSVLMGEGLAANLGAKSGDRVVLLATTAQGGINAVELTVAGTFATASKAYDDSVLRVPISVARKLVRVEGATSWVVLLEDTELTNQAVERIRASLEPKEFEVTPWNQLADFYNKTVELFSRQVAGARILIGLIIILTISNTLSMSVVERTGEIGTSMAIGVKRSGVLSVFLWEGALLGIVGGVLGIALRLLLGEIISEIGIPMPPPPGMAHGYIGEIRISAGLVVDGFLLAFITTLIASLVPAWKASRMNIVDALRHQR